MEIWFAYGGSGGGGSSLRAIPKRELDRLLEQAGCKILHALQTDQIDAYLLSESSLFVSDRRIILKTCGQTRPLLVIGELLRLAREHAHMDSVSNVYYSRKNFFRPQLQPQLHATFDEEINQLDGFFNGGTAYCMGPLKQDRWYLYTLMTNMPKAAPLNCSDHTLELQMSGIPAEMLRVYSWAECPEGAAECTKRSGILGLLPAGTLVQDELFKPVGYSMNGVLAGHEGEYVTIHVTPEPEFCYVSFETNHRRGCLYEQTMRVLALYRPARFILTLFANEHSMDAQAAQQRLWRTEISGYKRSTVQMLRLQYETVLFALYIRDGNGTATATTGMNEGNAGKNIHPNVKNGCGILSAKMNGNCVDERLRDYGEKCGVSGNYTKGNGHADVAGEQNGFIKRDVADAVAAVAKNANNDGWR